MVPPFNGPIYEGIFTNICSLFPSTNFTRVPQVRHLENKERLGNV